LVRLAKCMLLVALSLGSSLIGCGYFIRSLTAPDISADAPVLQTDIVAAKLQTKTFQLPQPIIGTTLIAERLAAYDGPFLEDGTGDEVTNIAALVVRNTGVYGVSSACITLEWDSGAYKFAADMIPAGESVLLLELSRGEYEQRSWTDCTGTQEQDLTDWTAGNKITLKEVGVGTLLVTNEEPVPVENVQLYYKSYLSPPGIFVGGITYSTEIKRLEAGETTQISPDFFVNGFTKILCIRYKRNSP